MCTSRPKIPDNKTPPAPLAPEAAPDAPQIMDRARYQLLRSRGMLIPDKPDLSGLGNQDQGKPVSRLLIRPGTNVPISPEEAVAAADARANAAAAAASQTRPNQGIFIGSKTPGRTPNSSYR